MSWLKWCRFLSCGNPFFKAVTSGYNLLNRQRGLRQTSSWLRRPWNCPCFLLYSCVQPLNQKVLVLHSGLSVRIIKDPKGHAGSVQTQAQAWKIKVMEMGPGSEEQPWCPRGIQCRVASTQIHMDKNEPLSFLYPYVQKEYLSSHASLFHKHSFHATILIISSLLQ